MGGLIEKIGRSFLVSAFIPSLAYVTLAMVIFSPIVPEEIIFLITRTFSPLDQTGLVLLLLTLIIGFTLYSLNTYLYKLIEGYFVLEIFPSVRRYQQHKAKKEFAKIIVLKKMIQKLENGPIEPKRLEKLEAYYYQLNAIYQRNYPPSPEQAMPSRFGNILRAMEAYPRARYGIDAVLFWPRLIHVMPDTYFDKLDQSNNRLAFLINCALLSLGMTIATTLAAGYQFLLRYYALAEKPSPFYFIKIDYGSDAALKYQQNAIVYVFAAFFMMFLLAFFYSAALPIAIQYGDLVRSSFDLFRWKLHRALNLIPIKSYNKEQSTWQAMSRFVAYGDKYEGKELLFDYSRIAEEAGTASNQTD